MPKQWIMSMSCGFELWTWIHHVHVHEYEQWPSWVATRLTRHTVLIFLPDPERSLGTSIFAPNVKAEGDASETSRHAHTHGCHCCLFLQTSCPCLFPLLWLIQDKRNRLCVVDHSSGPIFFNCVGDHAKAHFPYVFHFVDQLLQSDHLEFMPCQTVKKKWQLKASWSMYTALLRQGMDFKWSGAPRPGSKMTNECCEREKLNHRPSGSFMTLILAHCSNS